MKYKYYRVGAIVCIFVLASCKEKPANKEPRGRVETTNNYVEAIRGGDTAKQVLEMFCRNQFLGEVAAARYDYGKVSLEYQKNEDKITGNAPPRIDTDPLVIVSTYYISGVQLNETCIRKQK